jgi:hypothetical protein
MRRGNQTNSSVLACAGGFYLSWPSNLIDNHNFGCMVLHALDHDRRLPIKTWNHHSSRKANTFMGNVTIACNLVTRINDANVASL